VRRSMHFMHHLLEGHPPNEKEERIPDVCGVWRDLDDFCLGGVSQ
jgi:hypothetical protein